MIEEMDAEDFNRWMTNQTKKQSKYRNKKVRIDGITFDSKVEGARYLDLKRMEEAGDITELQLQPRYKLRDHHDNVIAEYVADFSYYDVDRDMLNVIEDVKGTETAVFKLKRKWFEASYNWPITIITKKDVDVSQVNGMEIES